MCLCVSEICIIIASHIHIRIDLEFNCALTFVVAIANVFTKYSNESCCQYYCMLCVVARLRNHTKKLYLGEQQSMHKNRYTLITITFLIICFICISCICTFFPIVSDIYVMYLRNTVLCGLYHHCTFYTTHVLASVSC